MNLPATLSVDLLEDEKPPSLSRRLTSMKNHFTSFSGRIVKAEECICWSNTSKARSKKTIVDEELCEFQTMWSIKKHDLALKERLSKIKLLDNLIAKQGPLADYEEALKKKLINELMSN
ncbi:hypothetical protein Bca4012_078083 [Brassica carinata]|uniref:Uncharacterized protein n=1 Tax=Brassica carinata TaxID=52824 RepID=A0A8X7QC30_BRACI|nr:hypothetical protein Bca52824_071838 [Brassica carinata]